MAFETTTVPSVDKTTKEDVKKTFNMIETGFKNRTLAQIEYSGVVDTPTPTRTVYRVSLQEFHLYHSFHDKRRTNHPVHLY